MVETHAMHLHESRTAAGRLTAAAVGHPRPGLFKGSEPGTKPEINGSGSGQSRELNVVAV